MIRLYTLSSTCGQRLFYGISWDKIILDEARVYDNFNNLINVPKYNAVIYTNTQDLHEIETLVKRLPNVCVHVPFYP